MNRRSEHTFKYEDLVSMFDLKPIIIVSRYRLIVFIKDLIIY